MINICLIKNFIKMKTDELVSLNSEYSEFDLQKLEERLETDPLAVGGLVDLITTEQSSDIDISLLSDCECHCGTLSRNRLQNS